MSWWQYVIIMLAVGMVMLTMSCAIINPSPRGEVSSLIAYQAGRKACLSYLVLQPYSPSVKASAEAGWAVLVMLTDSDMVEDELEQAIADNVEASQRELAGRFAELILSRVRSELPHGKLTPQIMNDIRLGVTEAWQDWTGGEL